MLGGSLLQLPMDDIVLLSQHFGKLQLVIIEQVGIGHNDGRQFYPQCVQDGTRSYASLDPKLL